MGVAIVNFIGCITLFLLSLFPDTKLSVHGAYLVAIFMSAHAAIAEHQIIAIKRVNQ